jgi:hypothetical protein
MKNKKYVYLPKISEIWAPLPLKIADFLYGLINRKRHLAQKYALKLDEK